MSTEPDPWKTLRRLNPWLRRQYRPENAMSEVLSSEPISAQALPRYRSHKIVWALKIHRITPYPDGTAVIDPEEAKYGPIVVSAGYLRKHEPQPGGYYVQYEDGYRSFSPAAAFEAGYTRLSTPGDPTVMRQTTDPTPQPITVAGAPPEPLLQFFEYAHLPPELQEVSMEFRRLADMIVGTLPRNPERTVALRKLLEAKDCAVRAKIWKG